ncbi:hypothetical protein C2E31_24480 [Rhodopirellula baltica]|nr:hypothetical protein C2E31_24480 [Rhodopirellula baltica]
MASPLFRENATVSQSPFDSPTQLEKPIYGYLVITVALIVGMVSASVFGQPPKDLPPEVAPIRSDQGISSAPVDSLQRASGPIEEHVAVNSRQWILGVRASDTRIGAVVTSVVPLSAAAHAGLEAGDRILAINGLQAGSVGRRIVPLFRVVEMADGGNAEILVQKKSSSLKVLNVQLQTPEQSLGLRS